MNLEDPYEDAQSTYHLMDPTGPCVRKWGLYVLPLFPDVNLTRPQTAFVHVLDY